MARKTWFVAIGFTVAVAIIGIVLAAFARGKFSWGPPEVPKAQCEALALINTSPAAKEGILLVYRQDVANAIVREPQNTWSNLAFVFVGALIWTHDRRIVARLLGAATISLGIASGLYHASLLTSWRTVDVATMGWVSFALCCYGYRSARRVRATRSKNDLWIGVAGGVLAMTAAFFRNDVRIAGMKPFDTTYTTIAGIGGVFALAVAGILRAIRTHPPIRLPVARLAVIAAVVGVAVFCQLNDRAGRCLCAPDGIVQGHALWHMLMATAVALAYDLFALIEGQPLLGPQANYLMPPNIP